jgi:hypothetical protein
MKYLDCTGLRLKLNGIFKNIHYEGRVLEANAQKTMVRTLTIGGQQNILACINVQKITNTHKMAPFNNLKIN